MRQMFLSLLLTPEEETLWKGRNAMVVPLTEIEARILFENVRVVHEKQASIADFLKATIARYEAQSVDDQVLCDALAGVEDSLRILEIYLGQVREWLERAVFIGPATEKGPIQ